MINKYFKLRTSINEFESNLNCLKDELLNKKIIFVANKKSLSFFNKKYNIEQLFKPIQIVKDVEDFKKTNNEFDYILLLSENSSKIKNDLINQYCIDENKIRTIFKDTIQDESEALLYVLNFKFDKTLWKLEKTLKNKRVLLYGASSILTIVKKYFNLDNFNIIGVADRRFADDNDETFLDYKTYSPAKILELNPDYVVVSTKFYVGIIEDLYYSLLKDTKIKIKPLIKKDLITLIKEIWE